MLFLLFATFLPLANCWGSLGHRTVALLAQLHFTPTANTWVNDLLNGQDISEAALYPDKIRHLPQYAYTAGWHFIDAHDDPPRECSVNVQRDCLDGCVVSAITNHTSRLADPLLQHWERGQSLRFVLHFFGDIHQPLHTENEDRGGNDIHVVFDRKHTNLHTVWDTSILVKHAGDHDEVKAAKTWAMNLYQPTPLNECLHDATECALQWAGEANRWVCSYVLKDDIEGLPKDLGHEYYEGAVPIVDELISKAGRRLAAWINDMASPSQLQVQS